MVYSNAKFCISVGQASSTSKSFITTKIKFAGLGSKVIRMILISSYMNQAVSFRYHLAANKNWYQYAIIIGSVKYNGYVNFILIAKRLIRVTFSLSVYK